MTTLKIIREHLKSDKWTEAEKWVIKWQYRLLGDFQSALVLAITRADDENLVKLQLGFPMQVEGFKAWAFGGLGQRFRDSGLEI